MFSPKANREHEKQQRVSTIGILAGLILFGALALFGLNIYSHQECQHKTPEELDEYILTINRRLLEAESENIKNSVMMDKILHLIQAKLGKLEREELEQMMGSSQDEAVKISILLASQPAPPLPHFYIDPKYTTVEKLADVVDSRFTEILSEDAAGNNLGFSEQKSSSELDDGEQESASISDKESSKKCHELQNKYNVVLGVSWGTLPYDLQTLWKTHECDYHLSDSSSLISQSEYKGQFND